MNGGVEKGEGKDRGNERGKGEEENTLAAVGCTHPSLTFLAVLPTVVVNHPNPLLNAATGSFCKSSNPGNAASFLGASAG
jgi:hypothetical protein